ncbi:MAG TPA: metal ABC transporter substrate-binding protein [Myxococcaceae bacterium]|nr:metal ABC transporter substrate-binding protein [Myxococcaceae bacterium]
MLRFLFRLVSLVFALGVVFPAAGEEKLHVVTTIETFADFARRVGGDEVEVQSLSHGYQDPHFVEAKPNLVVILNRADLLIRVGLDLEIGWLPPLVVGSRNARIQRGQSGDLDLSTMIDPLDIPTTKVDRSQGDIHPLGNPHYWLPPVNAVRCARGIRDRLADLRPQRKAYFDEQFRKFVDDLKAAATRWETEARPLSGLKVVTYHKSWSYVSRWLRLVEVGYIEDRPGIPPSPSHLAQLIETMRIQGVRVIIVESFYNRSIAENVADKAGAKVVPSPSDVGATPAIKTYFDLVDAFLRGLLDAMPRAN